MLVGLSETFCQRLLREPEQDNLQLRGEGAGGYHGMPMGFVPNNICLPMSLKALLVF